MWEVTVNGKVVKKYPFKLQAQVYCMLKGYVYFGHDEWNHFREFYVLDNHVKIRAVK
jgi:hypothetical protein